LRQFLFPSFDHPAQTGGQSKMTPLKPAKSTDMETPMPAKPEAPDPRDCCGEGCVRCVMDVYEQRLREWQEAVAALRLAHSPEKL
jgi:hypothetical protein